LIILYYMYLRKKLRFNVNCQALANCQTS